MVRKLAMPARTSVGMVDPLSEIWKYRSSASESVMLHSQKPSETLPVFGNAAAPATGCDSFVLLLLLRYTLLRLHAWR